MATMILVECGDVKAIADIYRARQLRLAELTAKKELVSMATAIDVATAKGDYTLSYRLSNAITRLKDEYYEAAFAIILADIEAAGYVYTEDERNGVVVGFTFSWENAAEAEEEEPVIPDPNDPVDPNEGGEGSGEGSGEGNEGSGEGNEGSGEGNEGSGEGSSEGNEGNEGSGEGSGEGNEGSEEGGEGSNPTEPEQPEEPVYTYRRLLPEDFINGKDVLPDGMEMEDLFYKVYPWDDTVEMLPMHELPFTDDYAYFHKELVEE